MSKPIVRACAQFRKWFSFDISVLVALRQKSSLALRYLHQRLKGLRRVVRKSIAPVPYRPQIEQLEVRQMPSISWVGGSGNNWSTAANWSGGVVPTSTDDVIISSGTIVQDYGIATIASLTMSGGTLNLSSDTLELTTGSSSWSGGTIFGSGSFLVDSGATLSISSSVTLNAYLQSVGTLNWSGGTISGSGSIYSEGTTNISATVTLGSGVTFDNYFGSITWTGGDITVNGTFDNTSGTVDVQTDADLLGSGDFINGGTFEKTVATGTTNIEVDFEDADLIDQGSGIFDFTAGTFTVDSYVVANGATIDGATVAAGSLSTLENVVIDSGTISVPSGVVYLDGSSNWNGGTITGSGIAEVESGATLTIEGAGSKTLSGYFDNYGTVDWTAGDIALSSATIDNKTGETWSMESGLNMAGSVSSTFENAGTLNVGGGASSGTNELAVDFTNDSTGTVIVGIEKTAGSLYNQLEIDGTATLGGTLSIQPLAGLDISNGDSFPVLTAGTVSGAFASETVGDFGMGVKVVYSLGTPPEVDIVPQLPSNNQGSDPANNQPIVVDSGISIDPSDGNTKIVGVGGTTCGCITGVDYYSDEANPVPDLSFSVSTSVSDPVPDDILAQLTWNGTPESTVTFDIPGLAAAGDTYDFTVQPTAAVTSTGNNAYSMHVEVDYTDESIYYTVNGNDFVVDNASSPYGAGWSLPNEESLSFDGSNVALISGAGGFAYFTDNSGTYSFTANMGGGDDPTLGSGTLVKSGSNYVYTDLNQVVWNFNGSGQLTSEVQPTGQTTTFGYTTGLLTSITKPGNWANHLTYSGVMLSSIEDGYITTGSVFEPTATSTFAFDGSGNLTSVTDADGDVRTFTYDGSHELQTDSNQDVSITYTNGGASAVSLGGGASSTTIAPQLLTGIGTYAVLSSNFNAQVTDGDGNVTTEHLDADGRPLSITSPDGATQSWTYNSAGLPLIYTDANGNVTTYSYYTGTRNVHTVATPDGFTTTYDYGTPWNTPTAVIDGYGRTTTYAFDGTSGQLTQTINPDGTSLSYTYSGGLLQSSVDARGGTTLYDYDSYNEVTAVVDPDHHTTLYTYDLATHTVTTTLPGSQSSVSVYDAQEQLIEQIDGNGHTAYSYYNADGMVTATVDTAGNSTLYDYDSAGRLVATIDPDLHTSLTDYDAADRVTAMVDGNGHTMLQYFDGDGHITATVNADIVTTYSDYSSSGLLTATVDGDGHTAYQDFSSSGLLTATVDANGNTTLYDYDSHRRLTATIDPDHRTVQQIYDAYGNVTATINGDSYTSHQYFDNADRVTASVDGNGHTSYTDYDLAGNVTATIDADGHTSLTYYDPDGNVTATVDGDHKTSYMDYDLDGRVTATVDADTHTSYQFYDGNSNVTATVDANGYTSYQYFDRDNRVTASVDADTSTTYTMYDRDGNVTETIDADHHTMLAYFDGDNQVTATVDGNGHTAYTRFDPAGNVTATVDVDVHTMLTYYDGNNQVTATVDGNGYTSYTLYDKDGNVTSTVTGAGNTSFQLFDAAGQMTATIDGNGHTSHQYFDGAGQITATVDFNGHTSYQDFDKAGQVTATVDADGYTSYQEFDPAGNVTVSIDANGYTTQQAFDGDNRLTQAIDNGGQTASYSFDAAGNLTQSINFDGYTTHQAFDKDGNVTQTIDTTGATSSQSFDPNGRLTMSIDGDHNTTYQQFDGDGNVTATVDGRGYTSNQYFDADGNVTASVDGDHNTTQYAYDHDGNQTAVIDPDHNTTTMAFDADGHVTQTISSTSGTTLQYYDGDGNVTQTIDAYATASATSMVYTFDGDDRQTQQLWYDSGSSLVDTQNKTYDNNGVLLTASNTNGTYTFAYDHDGRLTNVQEPFGVSLSYAYDGDGNQTQVVDSFGGTQTSVYDLQDRLITREYTGQSQEMRVDFTYGANGQVAAEARYNNLSGPAYLAGTDSVAGTDTEYDADGNVTSVQSVDPSSAVIDAFTYTYDRAGNLSTETDTQQGTTTTTSYSYDDANQVLSAGTLSYSYDANGNRPNADASTVANNQVSNDASWTYSYDLSGNLSEKDTTTALSDEHWTYAYNNKNELTEVKHYDSSNSLELTVDYSYDVFGNLIKEAATTGAGTTTTKFAVDGWNSNMAAPIGLENFNDWAVLNSGNTLQTRNLFGDKVDQVLGRVDQTGASDPSGQYWDLTDHLGSVRDVVDYTGALQSSVAYDAYGNKIGTEYGPSSQGVYGWTGRQVDLETGLQYNRARWYYSTTGRWMSQDPLGFDAGDSNLYRYAKNSPVTMIDRSGLTGQPGAGQSGPGTSVNPSSNIPVLTIPTPVGGVQLPTGGVLATSPNTGLPMLYQQNSNTIFGNMFSIPDQLTGSVTLGTNTVPIQGQVAYSIGGTLTAPIVTFNGTFTQAQSSANLNLNTSTANSQGYAGVGLTSTNGQNTYYVTAVNSVSSLFSAYSTTSTQNFQEFTTNAGLMAQFTVAGAQINISAGAQGTGNNWLASFTLTATLNNVTTGVFMNPPAGSGPPIGGLTSWSRHFGDIIAGFKIAY